MRQKERKRRECEARVELGTEGGELCDERILGGELDDLLLPLALNDLVDEGVLVVVAVLPVICLCIGVNVSESMSDHCARA
jgi:hypothetical protein